MLELDASGSYDPDRPDDGAGRLSYLWRCARADTDDDDDDGIFGGCTALNATSAVVHANLSAIGSGMFEFSVAIASEYLDVARNASARVTIEVSVDLVPSVSIAALGVAKANPSARLVLTGTVGASSFELNTAWSLPSGELVTAASDGDVSLAAAASTALAGSVAAGASATSYLVLPAATLTAGASYEFMLTASFSGLGDATDGYAVLAVLMNAPPTSGTFALAPRAGIVLATAFDYAAAAWVDDATDLPLLYSCVRICPVSRRGTRVVSHAHGTRVSSFPVTAALLSRAARTRA